MKNGIFGIVLILFAGFFGCTKKNHPPTTPTITASTNVIESGGSVNLTASSTDLDGDPLTYVWSATGGSFNTTTGTSVIWTAPSVSDTQQYSITVEVSDDKGASASNDTNVTVTPPIGEVKLEYYINGVYKTTVMDTLYNYESDLRYLGLQSGDFIAVYDTVVIQSREGDIVWTDNFETYPVGSWPTEWTQSGNADASGNEVTDSLYYSGSRALQLKGVFGGNWEAIAYRGVGLSDTLIIEFSLYPTGIGQRGNHPGNGGAQLKTGTDWTYQGRNLIGFYVDDMHIYGSNGVDLGPFSFGQWYRVKIIYTRP